MITTNRRTTTRPASRGTGKRSDDETGAGLKRTISLPLLVFYGLGVTVGAGIFALVGEIVSIAGARAPLSFLMAGTIAGLTGLCYAQLIARFPRAGGEAVYATKGLGELAGRVAGFGVVTTGVVSSAVVALAFAGYVRDLVVLPETVIVVAVVVGLTAVASLGIRESVAFAALITVLEVGTLVVIAAIGIPGISGTTVASELVTGGEGGPGAAAIFAGALVAFFAFVGFEDIANMAEETVDAPRNGPRAIMITLALTVVIYVVLSLVAVSVPDRAALVDSEAPMATLFELLTDRDGEVISAIAVVAMVNGILAQIVMAARMLYGMASEGLIPASLAAIHPRRQTPIRATILVSGAILTLALLFPMVGLARLTSLVTLSVFTLVDLSLFVLARRAGEADPSLARWQWYALAAATVAAGLAVWDTIALIR